MRNNIPKISFRDSVDPFFLYQVDAIFPDGRDYHAVANTPWKALIELGMFWHSEEQRLNTRLTERHEE